MCILVILSHFTPSPLQSFLQSSSDRYCESSGGERRDGRGLAICLSCCTIGTRLSFSNDALIISTLKLGCCVECQYKPAGVYLCFCGLPFGLSIFLYLLPFVLPLAASISVLFVSFSLSILAASSGILRLCEFPSTGAALPPVFVPQHTHTHTLPLTFCLHLSVLY